MVRPRFRWPQICSLTLLVAAGTSGGCHKLFGEYEVIEEPPPPPPPTTLCVTGDLRCLGPFLYTCGADLQSWTYLETCLSDARCQSREGGCKPCVPGEYRCDGARLELCNADDGWTLAEDCGDPNACNLNSESCRTCTEGEYQCNQASLSRCAAGVWELQAECANPAACSVAPDKSTGMCAAVDPRCTTAEMHVCDGATLLRCSASRDRLVPIETCASAAHCNAAAADQQAQTNLLATCLDECEPDATRCVDAEFQRCSADGVWVSMTACGAPGSCSAKLGASGCAPCAAGALECNDGELRRCAPESPSGWEIVADCGVARLCNEAEGRCEAGACPRAGQTRCDAALERCYSDQSGWDAIDLCDDRDLCNAHDPKCELAVCEKDARRCWEGNLQQCDDSRQGWDTVEECESDETCSLEGCTPGGCTDGEQRCNDVHREACVAGVWERQERCATAALCNATAQRCEPPTCDAKAYTCSDGTLRRCAADRTGYESSRDCDDVGLTCDRYAGACR